MMTHTTCTKSYLREHLFVVHGELPLLVIADVIELHEKNRVPRADLQIVRQL